MKKALLFWVLLSAAGLCAAPAANAAPEKEKKILVEVRDLQVSKVKEGVFRITAAGIAGSPGWTVNLYPAVYRNAPETWVLEAAGLPPAGKKPQVPTAWEASTELSLPSETQQIVVKGSTGSVRKPVSK